MTEGRSGKTSICGEKQGKEWNLKKKIQAKKKD
jgi:hypothetical protein